MATVTKPASKLAKGAFEWARARKARAAVKIRSRSSRDDAEAHRQRGVARLKAATGGGATKVLRIDITNVLTGNDYSAQLVESIYSKRSEQSNLLANASRRRRSL